MLHQANFLPITEAAEVRAFLRTLPFAVDGEAFTRFVLGFPHRYLTQTPPAELVRQYALMSSLGARPAVTALSRGGTGWRLCVIARDRSFLFMRIVGSLTCFGMDIVQAEAFANANALVLDTFAFSDAEAHLEDHAQRRQFQAFVEDVVGGKADVEAEMARRNRRVGPPAEPLSVEWDPEAHPAATRVLVQGEDRFGLLYLLSRCIAQHGESVEMAYIDTPGGRVRDEFYLTRGGARLDAPQREELGARLAHL